MDAGRSQRAGRGLRVMHVMESTIGGTRRHITDVGRGLVGRGLEVHLVVSAERQPDFRRELERLAAEGCAIHELPMVRSISPVRDGRHLLALERLLERVRPDIVHTHSSKAGVLGRLASLCTGVGVRVHTPHTLAFTFREMFGPLKRALFYHLERQLAGHTRRYVAVSASEACSFASSGVVNASKVSVVCNGVDPRDYENVAPIDIASSGLVAGRTTAAVIGLLNIAKGQDWAIESLLHPGNGDLQLLLAGAGPMRTELEDLAARLGVAERVAFLGFREDVPSILAACDFLLLPSRWEGMPYVVLEAMASGRAVVATPVNGASDLVVEGETGWLAETTSGEALAEVLADVLAGGPGVLRSAGEKGRIRVGGAFTTTRMVDDLVDLYSNLA